MLESPGPQPLQTPRPLRDQEETNLDFLRSVAVTCVVVFHLLLVFNHTQVGLVNLMALGHWGVLMFFVHTSLVLMYSLERQDRQLGKDRRFALFMIRRCFRLFPLSVATTLLIYWLHAPLEFANGAFVFPQLGDHGLLANLLLMQNIAHVDSIQAPLWSLPYELQMYLLLPLLFAWINRTRSARPLLLLWVLSVLTAIEIGGTTRLAALLPYVPWDLAKYAPCFIAGVLAYQLQKTVRARLPAWGWPIALLVISSSYVFVPHYDTSWFACFLLGLSIPLFEQLRSPALTRIAKTIARYSYGIYLTHFFCIWLCFSVLRDSPRLVSWTVFFGLLTVLSLFFYHCIEEPMIRMGARLARRLREPAPSDAKPESLG